MEKKGVLYYIFCAALFLFICAVAWYLLRDPDVHDQRERAREVTESFDSIGAEQQRAREIADGIGRGLDDSIDSTERIEERNREAADAIEDAAGGNETALRIVGDSKQRIAECQDIIQGIRKRTGQDGK